MVTFDVPLAAQQVLLFQTYYTELDKVYKACMASEFREAEASLAGLEKEPAIVEIGSLYAQLICAIREKRRDAHHIARTMRDRFDAANYVK